jgi:hypothetical protein
MGDAIAEIVPRTMKSVIIPMKIARPLSHQGEGSEIGE